MRIVISVISDLVTDQRVHRTALTLHEQGFHVLLIGRKKRDSADVIRPYRVHRFKLWWEKGPFFYIAFNLRLFLFLLFEKADVLVANDLDTLLPNYLVSRVKRARLYYDSHEYFTEVPELVSRPRIQKIWKRLERWIFPKLNHIYTVNDSIAALYRREYDKPVAVVRNVPITMHSFVPKTRAELGLPGDQKILLFQGAGINVDRCGEEAVQMMQYLDGCLLLFIGSGDVIGKLKNLSADLKLEQKIRFIPKLPLDELRACSAVADIGLSLDKDTNLNYRYSLPNKIFDYIHAGLPVLATDLVEVRKIVEQWNIGLITRSHDPVRLSGRVKEMFADSERFFLWKENLKLAAGELCWEKESRKLLDVFRDLR